MLGWLGGSPGVAGREFNGMESPIITSVASTVTLLAAPVIGVTIWFVRQGVGHARGSARLRTLAVAG
jgi:hypothetical protein